MAAFVFALALRARRAPAPPWAFNGLQFLLAGWAVVSLVLLYVAIHQGLLFRPDMQVAGGGSTDTLLRWYVLHVLLLPFVTVIFMAVHFWRVRKDGGISGPL